MNMKTLTGPVARVLYILPWLLFGLGHFTNTGTMAGMVPAFLPAATMLVYLTGAVQIAAAVMIVIDKNGYHAALLLALMAVVYSALIHFPAMMNAASDMDGMMAMTNLYKDLALAGGALAIAGVLAPKDPVTNSYTA